MEEGNLNIYLLVVAGMLFSFLMCGAVILFYIRYHKRLYDQQEKIKEAELKHQKELLHATIQSQENERKRIGQDLHDDVGSILSNLRILVGSIGQAPGSENKGINLLIDNAINNVRTISHRLSPATLEYFGLSDALEELFNSTQELSGINISVQYDNEEDLKKIPYSVSLQLYRVFEELMTNTIRHAEAQNIFISATFTSPEFVFTYQDDGKGFDKEKVKEGIGLHNISSRISTAGGFHRIESGPGKGIKVYVNIPIMS